MQSGIVYNDPPLVLEPTRLRDALGVIELGDLPDPQPKRCSLRLSNATPMTERLWRIALADAESNVVKNGKTEYFGAGTRFGVRIYNRDISYSGVLGLNRIYPDLMRKSLQFKRKLRLELGFTVSKGHEIPSIGVDWNVAYKVDNDLIAVHKTNSYTRRTDDVVWLWCAEDLFKETGGVEEWRWVHETGKVFFERFYEPFYDPQDGLYRGQATFVDVHRPDHNRTTTGYPQHWSFADCVLSKATCTNCLYVKGLEVMAHSARRIGLKDEARRWSGRADALREAIRRELRRPDGTYAYYKHRGGRVAQRRGALGSALTVLMGVAQGDDAVKALAGYPVTDAGVPLFLPFFPPTGRVYHNLSSWPFVDTFFLKALEMADGKDRSAQNAALLARTCRGNGTFHEVVEFETKRIRGSGSQLWTAAAFVDTCRRAGLVDL